MYVISQKVHFIQISVDSIAILKDFRLFFSLIIIIFWSILSNCIAQNVWKTCEDKSKNIEKERNPFKINKYHFYHFFLLLAKQNAITV